MEVNSNDMARHGIKTMYRLHVISTSEVDVNNDLKINNDQ